MSQNSLLKQYKKDIEDLKSSAKNVGLNDNHINKIIKEVFEDLKRSKVNENAQTNNNYNRSSFTAIKIIFMVILSVFFIYVLLNVHQTTSSIVLRNVQGLTYPALKIVRILSVPIIKYFPGLTDFYDETCLVENPFFYVTDMDCWPCQNAQSVINLNSNFELLKTHTGIPFIAKNHQNPVYIEDIKNLYSSNKISLDLESRRIKSNVPNIKSLKDLSNSNINVSSDLHFELRVNKMVPAQVLRKLFPRPHFINERSGQSVERFLIIDGANAKPYMLPNTECSFIFVIQGSGKRTIVLKPTKECTKKCKTISVVLEDSDILWYNWWYWRPISLPYENSTGLSISYINSYC